MSSNSASSRIQGNDESDKADLLVFGYACKLFRDDEKAELIEQGSHLIPWMGDEKLKIDRYDGRGALYDLLQYEACNQNNDWSDTAEDCEEDHLCEYERYRSLYLDEVTEEIYKEERAKRTQADHAEIAYEYDNPVNDPSAQEGNQETEIVGSKPFVPPPELILPPNIQIPTTVKHNAIIVRTALFLAQQGSQMEILMKVKQQSNRNFDFLSHTDPLHEYYKHVLGLIKSGTYVPQEQHLEETDSVKEESDAGDYYLHPSLVTKLTTTNNPSPPPSQVEIKPKPPPPIETAPPDYVQKIIEKMVKYVVKNGPAFEATILKRGDVRFSFLNTKNPYNVFYKEQLAAKQKLEANKVQIVQNKQQPTSDKEETKSDSEDSLTKSLKRKPLPVCFSIKKPKENEGLEVASALPVEESSDEEETTQNSNSPKPKIEPETDIINTLDKRLKKSAEVTRKHRQKKDANLQNERKLKVAQFLKDLKKKSS